MAKPPGLRADQHSAITDLMQRADHHLLLVEQQLQQAYGRAWQAKTRTLRRHLKGLQEDVRRRYLEQEVERT